MTNFFTSDTHFSHARIIELCDRPWSTTEAMDEDIIRRWNSIVTPEDTVFHMGDVALGKIAQSLPLVGRLNGYKILVPGNHDRISSAYEDRRPAFRERFVGEYGKVFQEIYDEVDFMWLDNKYVALSHYPYVGDSQENDRHVDLRPVDNGLPLIHGHIHNTNREGHISGRMFHVGMDVHDYYPVHEDQIIEWLRSLG